MSENGTPKQELKDLPTKSPDAAAQAREQAAEYESIFAPRQLTLDDGYVIEVPPHPNLRMFDDDAQAEYEELELRLESFDRHPDVAVPEQNVYDDKGNLLMTLPPSTQPGALKGPPHRKTDEHGNIIDKLEYPYQVMVARIALGEEDYARLRAGKIGGRRGRAADVWRIWNEQGQAAADRQKSDSKSAGGAVDSAPVPAADPS